MTGDVQPLVRFGVSCLSERGGRPADGALGRRRAHGHGLLRPEPAGGRWRARRRDRPSLLQSAIEAPAGTFPVVLAAGDSGILLHEAIGHGLEADFNRKKTSNYTDRIGKLVASELCTVVDDGTIADSRGSLNVDDEGNLPGYNVLIENGVLAAYLQDRMSAKALRHEAVRQRPARVVQALPDAAHDQHLHARRPVRAGRDHPRRRARASTASRSAAGR